MMLLYNLYMFIQAEDGIRDYKVTGVQTCALPIFYERHEDYWDPDAVGAAGVEFVILPDNVARFNAIQSHQVDGGSVQPDQIAEIGRASCRERVLSPLFDEYKNVNGDSCVEEVVAQ